MLKRQYLFLLYISVKLNHYMCLLMHIIMGIMKSVRGRHCTTSHPYNFHTVRSSFIVKPLSSRQQIAEFW
ncbi:hypothetical protein RB195_010148 [Necator americanus]|uniref:Secreted protein n=1 Tax=Necator americanus TaxID=51031 RepID=A0ABR1CXS2_NECAM